MSNQYNNIHITVKSLDKLASFGNVTLHLNPIKTPHVIIDEISFSRTGTVSFDLFEHTAQIVKFNATDNNEYFMATVMNPTKDFITRANLLKDKNDVFYLIESDYETEQTIEQELKGDVEDSIMLVIEEISKNNI